MITKETIRENITSWPELGINYWAINKNASSTIINHFCILTDNLNKDDVFILSGQKGKTKIRTRHIDSRTAFSNGLKNFAIVRDPYSRFESCYKHFKFPLNDIQIRSSKKARFNPDWSADDFLRYIEKKFDIKDKAGNKHFWRQSSFLHTHNKLDFIIKLEELDNKWPFDFKSPDFCSNPSKKDANSIIYNKELLYKIYKSDFSNFGYDK